MELKCFKAYDIRGEIGSELNEDIAYKIGRAFGDVLNPGTVVLGSDPRLTSDSLKLSLSDGIRDSGHNVIDIGMVGTEQVYFATVALGAGGGIEVTASHNPISYNGMKPVAAGAKPITYNNGLSEIKRAVEKNSFVDLSRKLRGTYSKRDILDDYIKAIIKNINIDRVTPLKIVMNPGNGAAGPVIEAFEKFFSQKNVPLEILKFNQDPDGTFPNGIPNPMLKENRLFTSQKVIEHNADLGIAWDGDFDRCFFFDDRGQFIEGYYIVGLLAKTFLTRDTNNVIVHDPRLIWNTIEVINNEKGRSAESRSGHTFMKEKMRQENAVYGGEMSAHHYFRDFFYCDSGMIPWLLIVELICATKETLSCLVEPMIKNYPSSGEVNLKVRNVSESMQKVLEFYRSLALRQHLTDGLSMEFADWRFNLRASNTEPLLRLNLESRGCKALVQQKLEEMLAVLNE